MIFYRKNSDPSKTDVNYELLLEDTCAASIWRRIGDTILSNFIKILIIRVLQHEIRVSLYISIELRVTYRPVSLGTYLRIEIVLTHYRIPIKLISPNVNASDASPYLSTIIRSFPFCLWRR